MFVLDRLSAAELDGFSLAFDRAPVVAVNGSPQISRGRRVFTLMHELAHVALRFEGLCNLTTLGEPPVRPVSAMHPRKDEGRQSERMAPPSISSTSSA